MKLTSRLLKSPSFQILFFAVLLAAASVSAQDRAQSVLIDSRLVVIPMRTLGEIATDMDNATAAKQLALDRKAQADNRLKEIEIAIGTKEKVIEDIDRRKDDAKTAKRESEVISLEVEKKVNQQVIDLLKRLKDLRKTEIDEAQVAADLEDVNTRVFQLESELQRKRMEYDSLSTGGASTLTQSTAQQVLGELEMRLLKLQQDQASATQKLASKQKDIITRRMKLYEAQRKLGMPRA